MVPDESGGLRMQIPGRPVVRQTVSTPQTFEFLRQAPADPNNLNEVPARYEGLLLKDNVFTAGKRTAEDDDIGFLKTMFLHDGVQAHAGQKLKISQAPVALFHLEDPKQIQRSISRGALSQGTLSHDSNGSLSRNSFSRGSSKGTVSRNSSKVSSSAGGARGSVRGRHSFPKIDKPSTAPSVPSKLFAQKGEFSPPAGVQFLSPGPNEMANSPPLQSSPLHGENLASLAFRFSSPDLHMGRRSFNSNRDFEEDEHFAESIYQAFDHPHSAKARLLAASVARLKGSDILSVARDHFGKMQFGASGTNVTRARSANGKFYSRANASGSTLPQTFKGGSEDPEDVAREQAKEAELFRMARAKRDQIVRDQMMQQKQSMMVKHNQRGLQKPLPSAGDVLPFFYFGESRSRNISGDVRGNVSGAGTTNGANSKKWIAAGVTPPRRDSERSDFNIGTKQDSSRPGGNRQSVNPSVTTAGRFAGPALYEQSASELEETSKLRGRDSDPQVRFLETGQYSENAARLSGMSGRSSGMSNRLSVRSVPPQRNPLDPIPAPTTAVGPKKKNPFNVFRDGDYYRDYKQWMSRPAMRNSDRDKRGLYLGDNTAKQKQENKVDALMQPTFKSNYLQPVRDEMKSLKQKKRF